MTEMATAERIANAALAILVEDGAEAVTMRRVAAQAGVSTMATYRHYSTRDELLHSVAEAAFTEVAKDWGDHQEHADPDARLEALMGDFLDLALGKPNLYRFLLIEQREQARLFPDDYRDSPAFRPVLNAVEQWMAEGMLRPDDPMEVTLAITAEAQGLVQMYLSGRIGLAEPEFRGLVLRTVRRVFHGIRSR